MHPLATAIQAACDGALDFFIFVGGTPDMRIKMGLPPSVSEEYPLLLAFQAAYHSYSQPTPLDEGLACLLSFDTVYECRIPYSTIERLIIVNPEEDTWPRDWDVGDEAEPEPEPPPPDNVRVLRPGKKKKN